MVDGKTQDDDDWDPAGTSRGGINVEDNRKEGVKPESATEEDGKSQAGGKQTQKQPEDGAHATKGKPKTEGKGSKNSRRKAFITLSYIVVAYVVCWVPFQFVFDVSLAKPEAISGNSRSYFRRPVHGDVLVGVH